MRARLDFRSPVSPPGGLAFDQFDVVFQTHDPDEVRPLLNEAAHLQDQGYHGLMLLAYEAGAALNPEMQVQPATGDTPLIWLGFSRAPATPRDARPRAYTVAPWRPALDPQAYAARFNRVQAHISAGDTYQVNLTFPLHSRFSGDAASYYHALRAAQAGSYAAFVETDDFTLLSISPELFFYAESRWLTARPMKGTRPRGRTWREDIALRDELTRSPKERAENVMIVDMLRNDLGRVAEFGSVQVPRLFTPEPYPTLWQMTSTVNARQHRDAGLADLFAALFPCGSITGAPKVRTMQIIAEQEVAPRGFYCGTIGYLAPGGDLVFNVAIRTMTILPDGRAVYPVGSGLVADGEAASEYDECLLKARVLATAQPSAIPVLA